MTRGKTRRYSINYELIFGKGNTPNDKRIEKLKELKGKENLRIDTDEIRLKIIKENILEIQNNPKLMEELNKWLKKQKDK
jgi:hypothetical protein